MASAPSYVEQQALHRGKSVIENLLDFSFERMMTPRMLKVLLRCAPADGLGRRRLVCVQRIPDLHVKRPAGADHQLRGHASVDRVLPRGCGTAGRRVPRGDADLQFAGESVTRDR